MTLCQFSFTNFKSFKDEATLDLFAERISEHEDSLIIDPIDNEKFLPVISIYGPNGGGKSNVLKAFSCLSSRVLLPVIALKHEASEEAGADIEKIQELERNYTLEGTKHFKFDEACKNKPISFDVLFRVDATEYKYQLSILHSSITEENLYAVDLETGKAQIVFERSGKEHFLGSYFGGIAIGNIKSSMPLLSHLSINYEYKIIDQVILWLLSCRILNYNNAYSDKTVVSLNSEKDEKLFFEMLAEAGIDITSIRTEEDAEGEITGIYTTHCLEDGSCEELSFGDESSGTRKLFGLFPYLLAALNKGSLIIADEMDAKLHPKLLHYVIELFTNPKTNKNGAQLIFTSHDMYTMKPAVFRRDEIWFSALRRDNSSKLYSLVEFRKENGAKVRNDETYDKQYIEGRYGADPYLKSIIGWGECADEQ